MKINTTSAWNAGQSPVAAALALIDGEISDAFAALDLLEDKIRPARLARLCEQNPSLVEAHAPHQCELVTAIGTQIDRIAKLRRRIQQTAEEIEL